MRSRSNFYNINPTISRKLSNFDLSHSVATTMKVGELVPLDIVEVLPGDVYRSAKQSLVRLTSSFARPIMDDLYLDLFEFFVPLRLCQSNLEDVFGDNSPSAYSQLDLAEIASFGTAGHSSGKSYPGTVADYLGLFSATAVDSSGGCPYVTGKHSILPFRAFALIWNEWFRNQNVDQEAYVHLTETAHSTETMNNNAWGATNYMGKCPPVGRYKDYFATLSVSTQKGPTVSVKPQILDPQFEWTDAHSTLYLGDLGLSPREFSSAGTVYEQDRDARAHALTYDGGATVNDIRAAFQLEKYYVRSMLYGDRYREYLRAAFGVNAPDSRMQVPEFLASAHERLNVTQIAATASEGAGDYNVGQLAGMSNTVTSKGCRFKRAFTEHGYIITVGCIRFKHRYSQGVHRMWTRIKREQFFDPLFANLAFQAVHREELFISSSGNDSVLGYQEPFCEMRTIPDRVSGQMRPATGNLGSVWSLADAFSIPPTLSTLVHEDKTAIDRVLMVPTATQDPFAVDLGCIQSVARVVPSFGTPGLVDHH